MHNAKMIAIGLIIGGLFLTGCCSSPTMVEENWGRSVETTFFNQTIDPHAGAVTGPVEGIDSKTALKTLKGYRE